MDIRKLKKLSKKDRRLARQMARIQAIDQAVLDHGENAWYPMVQGKFKFEARFKSKKRYEKDYVSRCDTYLRGLIIEHTADTFGKLTFEPTIRQSNTGRWKKLQVKQSRPKHAISMKRHKRKLTLAAFNLEYAKRFAPIPVVKDESYTTYGKFTLVA